MSVEIQLFEYQQRPRFFAQVPGGVEALGVEELLELHARNVSAGYRGVYFEADRATLYRIIYTARLLTRVLAPLESFECHSARYLYRRAKEIRWERLFSPDQTFAVFANVSQSSIKHSQYAALCLKDAIADRFMDLHQRRPNVDRTDPDAWISLHIEKDQATVGFDISGGSLHRRGYRTESVEAPMQEVLAAAVIRLSDWDGTIPLYDPMCGSGTLLTEALMVRCRLPSALLRKRFGFERLPDFDRAIWLSVKKETEGQICELPEGLIAGSDLSAVAVEAAKANIGKLPSGDRIGLSVRAFGEIEELRDRVILCNPPYGIRLGKGSDLGDLYKAFGDFLKQRCKGSSAYIYFGNRELIPYLGLKPSWKRALLSGGLDGRLAKFEIY